MEKIKSILNYDIEFSETIHIKVYALFVVTLAMLITAFVLRLIRKYISKHASNTESAKFIILFSYSKWIIYVIIFLITLQTMGVNVSAILAASAAILIGVGLALQTFFEDIISGIFILLDKTLSVDDIIEIDGKVGRVVEIKLRTTRAVTIDNKVLVIPNHLYLSNTLYNYTQNGKTTRESIDVGVAYGSDLELVKQLLLQAANEHPNVLKTPVPTVVFMDFGDSALQFKLIFTLNDSFMATFPKSDIRFKIDALFRANSITIPFPQRDVNIKNN